ncbi:MAG: adenylosuccinate synthetase [Pseudonocardiaceae bacterium]
MRRIGSTGKGVGAASAEKVLRTPNTILAGQIGWLADYLGDVAVRANEVAQKGGEVFLEGTQGFGLSLHHGYFPYVTSRDTTAGALCSEAGLSPTLVNEIIMVVRTFPIRVAGPSGPLPHEIDWETITKESGAPTSVVEKTTVTDKVRRVARFDPEIVKRACVVNRPTQIALMFLDYLDWRNRSVTSLGRLTRSAQEFIDTTQTLCDVPVTLVGTGPRAADIIDLRGVKPAGCAKGAKV